MYPFRIAAIVCLVCLILPAFGTNAQTVPNRPEMATGDVWPSREEPVYVPREALELPTAADTGEREMATGDVWPAAKPGADLTQGRPTRDSIPAKTPEQARR
jgi:hypothetical protein